MNTRQSRFLTIASCALLTTLAGASGFEDPPGSAPRFDEGVLELVPGADIDGVLTRYGFSLRRSIPSRNIHLVSFRTALTDEQFEMLFLGDAEIDHSELNFDTGNAGPNSGSLFFNVAPVEFTAQPVWDVLGVGAAHAVATGAGTTIAFVDTGLDASNPLFAGRVHPAARSFVGDPADFADAGNGINDDGMGETDEMVGHGTWVAGIAATVAPNASLLPIRALDDEGFSDAFTLTQAIYHAIDSGANVINLSLGSVAQVRIVERAVDDAADLGIIVVAAAGNQASDVAEFPAGNNKAAGVASVALDGQIAGFSNFGGDGELLLSAPGVQIVGPTVAGYGEASGTSASVPFVAGTAALLIEKGTVRRWSDFREMAKRTAIDIRGQNPGLPDDALGEGMLDVLAAVEWTGPCFADLNDDDVLDLADVQAFIVGFTTGDEEADFVGPRGVWDLGDLQFFLQSFISGCP